MGLSLRKYTERSAKNKRSYQLRTGQMKLPVRKIEPVQYVDSKRYVTNFQNLPSEPEIGVIYTYNNLLVECIEHEGCEMCMFYGCRTECVGRFCSSLSRKDNKTTILVCHNA